MWWAIWCTMMLASSSTGAAAPAPDALAPLDMLQLDPTANDDESLGYAVQPMSGHYDAGTPWLYLLADIPRDSQVASNVAKRSRRSFSVNPAVELLQRNALLNYIGRVAHDNRNFLDRVGKRERWSSADAH